MISWHCFKLDAQQGPAWRAILRALESAIDTGTVRVGDLLPSQRLMADFMGVHVNTVNRAMREAAKLGLVTARSRLGTTVIAGPGT
jgi:GntR family transcriptional regulator